MLGAYEQYYMEDGSRSRRRRERDERAEGCGMMMMLISGDGALFVQEHARALLSGKAHPSSQSQEY